MIGTSPTGQEHERPRRRREWLLLLLALLTSVSCVFCSTQLALSIWPDRIEPASMLPGRQADYSGGPGGPRFSRLDPAIVARAATDTAGLRATLVPGSAGTVIAVSYLPSTPTPSPIASTGSGPLSPTVAAPATPGSGADDGPSPPGATATGSASATAPPTPGLPTATQPPSPTPLPPTVTIPPTPTLLPPTPTPLPTQTSLPPVPPSATPTPTPTLPPPDDGDGGGPGGNRPPQAVNDTAQTTEDTPITIAVLANDRDPDGHLRPETVTILSGLAGATVQVQPSTGSIIFQPAPDFNGTTLLTYQVCDNDRACGSAVVTIDVLAVADPPLALDDRRTGPEDTPLTVVVLANDSDPDGDPLTVTALSAPQHGSATLNPNQTVTYIPAPNFYGSDVLTYTVSDGGPASATARVLLTISPINDAPLAVDDADVTAEDTPEDTAVLSNDSDVEGAPLTITGVGPAQHGTATVNGAVIFYQPQPNFHGSDVFTYTISDGQLSSTATLSMTVTPSNDPPLAVADSYTTTQGISLTVTTGLGLLSNDSDVDSGDSLTALTLTDPLSGSLTVSPDGGFTYQPLPAFTGPDHFTYRAVDSTGAPSNVVTVTITVF